MKASARLSSVALVASLLASCATPSATESPVGSAATSPSSAASATDEPTPTPGLSPEQVGWHRLAAEVSGVSPREDHTWTLTADGATAYLFGGRRSDGTALDDLWAYDLASGTWEEVAAAGPSARFGHNAAWVDGVGLVVFAGQASADFFNDLWAYDPAADAWHPLPASGDLPVTRYGSCAAVGPDGRLWISHGFTADGQRFADTRAYDFSTGTWTDETPPDQVPIARCLHACWWTDEGALTLYAGQTTGVTALGDRWRLTLGPRQGTHAWQELAAEGAPAARNLYASARVADGTLVFGGQGLDGGFLADTWLLADDGTARQLSPAGSAPPGRSGGELIADATGGRVLLFGGRDADGAMADLWELDL